MLALKINTLILKLGDNNPRNVFSEWQYDLKFSIRKEIVFPGVKMS